MGERRHHTRPSVECIANVLFAQSLIGLLNPLLGPLVQVSRHLTVTVLLQHAPLALASMRLYKHYTDRQGKKRNRLVEAIETTSSCLSEGTLGQFSQASIL